MLRFIDEHNVDATTLLVSDWPGYAAYQSPSNRFVAADMLTGSVRFLSDMTESSNALYYLFDTASASGKPIKYVVFAGNKWLVPAPNSQCVVYNDPKRLPKEREIGVIHLGQPIDAGWDGGIIVWDTANARFDVSSGSPQCRDTPSR